MEACQTRMIQGGSHIPSLLSILWLVQNTLRFFFGHKKYIIILSWKVPQWLCIKSCYLTSHQISNIAFLVRQAFSVWFIISPCHLCLTQSGKMFSQVATSSSTCLGKPKPKRLPLLIRWDGVIIMTAHIKLSWWQQFWQLLRSAVGMTHSLRSDLWWTIPFRIFLGHFWDTPRIPDTWSTFKGPFRGVPSH